MMNKKRNTLSADQERFLDALWITVCVLILLNIINILIGKPFFQITRLIDFDYEGNFTTWFSSFILGIAAFYAYKCSVSVSENIVVKMWKLLSAWLILMSCDEVAQIHEHLGETIHKYLISSVDVGHSKWVVVLGPIILVIVLIFCLKIRKHLKQYPNAKKYLLIGMVIYIVGAFLLEFLVNFFNYDSLRWVWTLESILEESFEMIGVIFIIRGLQEYYNNLLKVE